MYSFSNYSKSLKNDWFLIANEEVSSCINAQDEFFLEKNEAYNLIIYKDDKKGRMPVAIFASNGIDSKIKGLIRVLDANSGGLFIKKTLLRESAQIKLFLSQEIIINYFKKEMGVDFIHFMYPALSAIEKSDMNFISNPMRYSYVNNNSMLYLDLSDDFIQKLKLIPRQEIRKGLKFIEKNSFINEKNEDTLEYFNYLDNIKSKRLSIDPLGPQYFKGLIDSEFYNVVICIDKNTSLPIGGFIYSLVGVVGDSIYIAGTDVERKHCVNKGLTYLAMEACKALGAKYFITGHGYTDGNMAAVTKYHRSISTNEVTSGMFRSPISFKAQLYTCLLLFKKQ